MAIQNDSEFRNALNRISPPEQRVLAARFTESVMGLCRDVRIKSVLTAARRPDISDGELNAIYQSAKSACVESYTHCGKETNWLSQAGHFVCEAAKCCVKPADGSHNLAWDAAMYARMARTFETIAKGEGTETREAQLQYQMVDELVMP